MLEWWDLKGHHRGKIVLAHVAQLPQLHLHQVEAAATGLANVAGHLAHGVGSPVQATKPLHLQQVGVKGWVKATRSLLIQI